MGLKESREKLSHLRQETWQLNNQRGKHIQELLKPQPMVLGSLYQVYKSCNYPNCRCQKGDKHGPFYALSISKAGKRQLKMVKEKDWVEIKEKAGTYRRYQKVLARIRKIDKEIAGLLEQVKGLYLEEY